jgi:MFS family permease
VTGRSLLRHDDFRKLWLGQTVSELGSVVTRTAVPLAALLVLGAGPPELAFLVVAASGAVLLVGFVAGAWVDRLHRRPLLITSDAIRAVLLASIPVAYATGTLGMEQLYVVTFLEAALGALFDVAYPAYVPSLVGVDRVVDANGVLATSSSIAEVGGPGLAGGLVQAIGAPFAILVDAASFVVSALSLVAIRTREPARLPRTVRTPILRDIEYGIAIVRRHPLLLPLAASSVVEHFFGSFYAVLYTIYLLHDLHLSPFLLGLAVSAGGVGSLVGSLFAPRFVQRLGLGGAIVWPAVVAASVGVLTPLAQGPVALAALMVFIPQLVGDGLQTIDGVARISLEQQLVDDRLRGRVNATMEVLSHGIGPFGALLAAAVAQTIGVRGTIAIGWAGMVVAVVIVLASPIRQVYASSVLVDVHAPEDA